VGRGEEGADHPLDLFDQLLELRGHHAALGGVVGDVVAGSTFLDIGTAGSTEWTSPSTVMRTTETLASAGTEPPEMRCVTAKRHGATTMNVMWSHLGIWKGFIGRTP
jgi:hypothetical protein